MMLEFGSIDGFFFDVKEGLDEMIKFLANEPSVGLFFLQQHANTSMPYLLNLEVNIEEKVHGVTFHTEDIEDSTKAVRSMTKHGFPIADSMVDDINRSLLIMSTVQSKKGFSLSSSWGFQLGRSNASPEEAIEDIPASAQQGEGIRQSYLSSVFYSAKQKVRWTQQNAKDPKNDELVPSEPSLATGVAPTHPDPNGKEVLVLSEVFDEQLDAGIICETRQVEHVVMLDNFNKFKDEQEAKLEEWLQETDPSVPVTQVD